MLIKFLMKKLMDKDRHLRIVHSQSEEDMTWERRRALQANMEYSFEDGFEEVYENREKLLERFFEVTWVCDRDLMFETAKLWILDVLEAQKCVMDLKKAYHERLAALIRMKDRRDNIVALPTTNRWGAVGEFVRKKAKKMMSAQDLCKVLRKKGINIDHPDVFRLLVHSINSEEGLVSMVPQILLIPNSEMRFNPHVLLCNGEEENYEVSFIRQLRQLSR